jgi:hypothetical protein
MLFPFAETPPLIQTDYLAGPRLWSAIEGGAVGTGFVCALGYRGDNLNLPGFQRQQPFSSHTARTAAPHYGISNHRELDAHRLQFAQHTYSSHVKNSRR